MHATEQCGSTYVRTLTATNGTRSVMALEYVTLLRSESNITPAPAPYVYMRYQNDTKARRKHLNNVICKRSVRPAESGFGT